MLRRSQLVWGATVLALTLGTGRARASSFNASAGPLIVTTSSTPIMLNNFNPSLGLFDANARAGASVGADATAFVAGTGPFTTNFSSQSAGAHSSIDDIVFSGPGPTVDATIHLLFDFGLQRTFEDWSGNPGFTAGSTTDQRFSFSFGGSNVQTYNTLNGSFSSGQETPDISFSHIGNDPQVAYSFTKIFEVDTPLVTNIPGTTMQAAGVQRSEDFFFAGQVTIHQLFPVGVPIFLDLQISADTTVRALYVASAFAGTDGFHSFGLPAGSSGFDLPAGYTVNADSIGLVNGVVPGATAPEPASFALFGTGCAALLALRCVRPKTC